ncbi:MAG TPA: divalent metal cation transporter [Saprospiraceae bacterium]|nr:divalent metal cation transporter [Saprospiraceae bacterium]
MDGYKRLGKPVLMIYFLLTLLTMFTIQAAVTIVTAGLASYLFGVTDNVFIWSVLVLFISVIILYKVRYVFLDNLMKIIVLLLTITSIIAVVVAFTNTSTHLEIVPVIPMGASGLAFFIAFLGWMPAPLDISIWQSLWTTEKQKEIGDTFSTKQSIFDFNVGFVGTIITGFLFMSLGLLMFYHSGKTLSPKAGVFAKQLIDLYTLNLGKGMGVVVGIAAFTTMFSTTITALDASPRAMAKTTSLLFSKKGDKGYLFWMLLLAFGSLLILKFFITEMGDMIKLATIISFLTAPFYAIANLWLVSSKHMPKKWHPSLFLKIWSIVGIVFLVFFSFWYLSFLF